MVTKAPVASKVRMPRTPRRPQRREEPGTIYTVVVLREDDGRYTAYVPALNDCASFGDTLPEALLMVQEAMSLYVATLRDHDWSVPADNPRVTVDMTESPEISVYRLPVRWEAVSA